MFVLSKKIVRIKKTCAVYAKESQKMVKGMKWARKLTGGAGASSDPNEINSGKQEGRQVRHCISPRHLHVT